MGAMGEGVGLLPEVTDITIMCVSMAGHMGHAEREIAETDDRRPESPCWACVGSSVLGDSWSG